MTVSQITRVADYPLALPRVTEGDDASKTASVTINLSRKGEIIVGGSELSQQELESALRSQLQKVQGDPELIKLQVRADRSCECKHVSQLLERLSKLGFNQVRVAVNHL